MLGLPRAHVDTLPIAKSAVSYSNMFMYRKLLTAKLSLQGRDCQALLYCRHGKLLRAPYELQSFRPALLSRHGQQQVLRPHPNTFVLISTTRFLQYSNLNIVRCVIPFQSEAVEVQSWFQVLSSQDLHLCCRQKEIGAAWSVAALQS